MRRFFDVNDPASFLPYSVSHWLVLLLFAGLVVVLYAGRQWLRSGGRRRYVRYGLAALLAACELGLNVWYVEEGVYSLKESLPLELCTVSLYLCVLMLLLRSYRIFQVAYFTGIGGAMQAMLTPVLGYPFPHFLFFEFFAAHIAIILAVLYMVWVEQFRPTMRSIAITMGILNVLLVLVLLVNYWTGGNYMFVSRKPETASLLDLLGPYPWYLLSLEGVAVVLFLLLYAPFALSRRRA